MTCRDGTGHTGHAQGDSGVQAGLVQAAGAPSWYLSPLLQRDGTGRLTHSPTAPLLWLLLRASTSSGLSLGTHTYPDSLGKQGPRRDTWLLPWAEETCD